MYLVSDSSIMYIIQRLDAVFLEVARYVTVALYNTCRRHFKESVILQNA